MDTCYAALDDRLLVGDGEWRERLRGYDLECVAADRRVPDRAFVGTVDAGLVRTGDGGRRWDPVLSPHSAGAPDRVTSVTVSPHDPDVVWAGTEPSAVYRSTDGGETWAEREGLTDLDSAGRWSFPPRPHTHHVRWLAVAPDDPDTVYVAVEAGAFVRSTDGGETWLDHPAGARRDNHTLAVHPAAPDRVYTAAGDGYARSEDRGETWTYPQSGLDHRYVWGLAVHPDDPECVVVSAASGAFAAHDTDGESYVYRRTDDGWTTAMAGLPEPNGLARAVLATDETGFHALTNHGLFRSPEGREWTRLGAWDDRYDQVPRGLAVV
ncbi:WD40/YVTN/BNR-like repeat-containing protein [Haloarcula litorea]|uniref:WD40/YVTN/BNR-like repeat-containing protein n=1 Tax=Haloarcula litorea TaxID=3032579 RepID=UPI0023E7CE2E|nr:hypothetical protein [Halomicroarcula sp. GDY20]